MSPAIAQHDRISLYKPLIMIGQVIIMNHNSRDDTGVGMAHEVIFSDAPIIS